VVRKEVLAFRELYRKEVLALLTSNCKEVLALLTSNRKEVLASCRIQTQATRKKVQEVAGMWTDTKRFSCVYIIFGQYCIMGTFPKIYVFPLCFKVLLF